MFRLPYPKTNEVEPRGWISHRRDPNDPILGSRHVLKSPDYPAQQKKSKCVCTHCSNRSRRLLMLARRALSFPRATLLASVGRLLESLMPMLSSITSSLGLFQRVKVARTTAKVLFLSSRANLDCLPPVRSTEQRTTISPAEFPSMPGTNSTSTEFSLALILSMPRALFTSSELHWLLTSTNLLKNVSYGQKNFKAGQVCSLPQRAAEKIQTRRIQVLSPFKQAIVRCKAFAFKDFSEAQWSQSEDV